MPYQGLYLLADESALPFAQWARILPPILDAGIALVQYRAKSLAAAEQLEHALQLKGWCEERHIPLLINDDPSLCQQIGAQGVHLGKDDAAIRKARSALGPEAIIGASCYNDLDLARSAISSGATYASFGRFFTSTTKPLASSASLDTLRLARKQLHAPICAIGGITQDNATSVLDAGAQMICVAGGILGAPDPVTATRKLATMCAQSFNT